MIKINTWVILESDYPESEFTIIFIIFFIILAVLIIHLIFRWFNIYSRNQPQNEKKEPEVKIKKIPSPKFKLMVGGTYLVLERTEGQSGLGFRTFKDELRSGDPGLLITRTYPDKIVKKYALGKLPVIWLSRSKKKNSVTPTNLGTIVEETKDFASQHENSVVMLDGLEYLTVHNEFDRVQKFLHSLQDEIAVNNSRLIIPVNPKALTKKKLAQVSNEIKILNKTKSKGKTKAKK